LRRACEIDDLRDVDKADLVVYRIRLLGRARHTRLEIDIGWTNVNWFREGRIYRSESFTNHQEASKPPGCRTREPRCRTPRSRSPGTRGRVGLAVQPLTHAIGGDIDRHALGERPANPRLLGAVATAMATD
jgi:hypothetical protein